MCQIGFDPASVIGPVEVNPVPMGCFVAQALIAKICSIRGFDAAMTCFEGWKGVIEFGWFSPKFRVSEPRDGEFFTTRIDRFSAIAGPGLYLCQMAWILLGC